MSKYFNAFKIEITGSRCTYQTGMFAAKLLIDGCLEKNDTKTIQKAIKLLEVHKPEIASTIKNLYNF